MIDPNKDKDTSASNTQEEQWDTTNATGSFPVNNHEAEPMQTDGEGITKENIDKTTETTKGVLNFRRRRHHMVVSKAE